MPSAPWPSWPMKRRLRPPSPRLRPRWRPKWPWPGATARPWRRRGRPTACSPWPRPWRPAPASEDAGHVIEGGIDWHLARVRPAPQLVCIGGVHIAMRLAEIARVMGFRTGLAGPLRPGLRHRRALPRGRTSSCTPGPRRPSPRMARCALTANTAVCALTHDPKIDVPALQAALASPAFYIGSLGRSTTQLSRCRQLAGEGMPRRADRPHLRAYRARLARPRARRDSALHHGRDLRRPPRQPLRAVYHAGDRARVGRRRGGVSSDFCRRLVYNGRHCRAVCSRRWHSRFGEMRGRFR